MKDSKLINILSALTAEDLRQIQKMLQSPFFTSNKNLVLLYKLLRSCHPDYTSSKLEKNNVFKKVFPNHKYSDIKLRNLNSELVKLIEEYLLIRNFRDHESTRRKELLKVYKDRQLYHRFEKLKDRMLRDLEKQPYRDETYYRELIEIRAISLEFLVPRDHQQRFEYFQEWDGFLERFYLLSKNRIQLAIKAHQQVFKNKGREEILVPKEDTLLTLFQYFRRLYDEFDVELFLKTKQYFENNFQDLRKKYQVEFLKVLINFAISRMSLDDQKYNALVFDLYKIGLQHDFYIEDKLISENSFFNIVVCASKAKAFEWVTHFIKDYYQYLSRDTRLETKKLSLSYLHFHKEEYEQAINILVGHSFKNKIPKVVGRIHLIRCYYELFLKHPSYFDLLVAELDAFERYLRRRSELPMERLEQKLHFVSFVRKNTSLRVIGKLNAKQKKAMYQELAKQPITTSRSWLKSIIEK